MNTLESINSSDIEIAELACNLLIKEIGIDEVYKLITNSKLYKVSNIVDDYITISDKYEGGLYNQIKKGNSIPYTEKYTKQNITDIMSKLFNR